MYICSEETEEESRNEPVADTSPFRVEPARLYNSPFLSFLAAIKLRTRLRGIVVGMNSAGILNTDLHTVRFTSIIRQHIVLVVVVVVVME